MAIAEPTRARRARHPVPPPIPTSADTHVEHGVGKLKSAHAAQEKLTESLEAIEDFANAIVVSLALEVERHDPALGAALHRIAFEIINRVDSAAEAQACVDPVADSARQGAGSKFTPWDIACQIEKPTHALSDYVDMLAIISCDDDLQREIASAISRLVQDMRPCLTKIEELRSRLFFDLHPRRHKPGFPPDNLDDAGNCAIEEAAGDVA